MPILFSKEKQKGDGYCMFSNQRQKGNGSDGKGSEKDLRGVEGEKTVIK